MINFKLFNELVIDENGDLYPIYNINLIDKLNFIIGLSGSGKTYLVNNTKVALNVKHSLWSVKCDVPVEVLEENDKIEDILRKIKETQNHLFICDEGVAISIREDNLIRAFGDSKNYFLICDRTSTIRFDINVNSIFEFKYRKYGSNKVFDIVKSIPLENTTKTSTVIKDITFLVTEDSTSGLKFWSTVFSKLIIPKFKRHGNGEVVKQIKYLLKKYEGNILVILDYDRGAIMMRKLLINKRIDKSRLYFMPLESFEEVICNSEFILSKFPELKIYVDNYKDYICPLYKSTGKYFSSLLFRVVKVKSPLKKHGEKDYTKFYKKGMKNFKECFIDDCCAYNTPDCKLYYEGDKKKAMLANKFEVYRKFI